MSTSMERVLRARFVQMVFLSCDMADFPIEVASLACKFAHRYVNHVGLDGILKTEKDTDRLVVAILFLVGKLSENIRRVRDLNLVVRTIHGKEVKSLETGEKWKEEKARIMMEEQNVLRVLGFSLEDELPIKFMLNYAHQMTLSSDIVRSAICLLNNFGFMKESAEMSANVIACAVIVLSERLLEAEGEGGLSPKARGRGQDKFWQKYGVTDEEITNCAKHLKKAQISFALDKDGYISNWTE